MANKMIKRATSVTNYLNMKIETIDFTGEWELAFGKPESGGIWYISGFPGSGKTSFVVQLIKEFACLGKRIRFYNFEEQESVSLQKSMRREKVNEVATQISMINRVVPFEKIKEELKTTRTNVAVIDSRKKARLTSRQVEDLRELFPHITIPIVCHIKSNGLPEQAADAQVFQEAQQKIKVDRFRALSLGRSFGDRGYYNIWKERGDKLWAENV